MKKEQKRRQLVNDTRLLALAAVGAMLLMPVGASFGAKPGFGNLFYNDTIVRTLVPPASFPNEGLDNFYKVTNGAEGQLGIAAVAPGDTNYHGGQWKVFKVTFNEGLTPYLLTSEEAVQAAEDTGDVTVERAAEEDFLCPVQK